MGSLVGYGSSYAAIVRAGVLIRLNALLNTRALSVQTITTLVAVLNAGYAPVGSSLSGGKAGVELLSGAGSAITATGAVAAASEVLSALEPAGYRLTKSEAAEWE